MKLLIVTYYFPPTGAIGSIRLGKLATLLLDRGHDVRVLTTEDVPLLKTTVREFPDDRVHSTKAWDVNRLAAIVAGGGNHVAVHGSSQSAPSLRRLRSLYDEFLIPDAAAGWLPFAGRGANEMTQSWRPDVVFSSYNPATALIAARRIAGRLDAPWVADFRDLWAANPYAEHSRPRRKLDAYLERRTLSTAASLTTVSEPLARDLRHKFNRPVTVVMNGYDAEDAANVEDATPRTEPGAQLVIRHMGTIYPGKRDPSALFEAISGASSLRSRIRVEFYGRNLAAVITAARHYGLGQQVAALPPVSRSESLSLQASADLLLLLTWNSPKEDGALPGKLFEYVGSRRPILVVGSQTGAAADLVRQYKLGGVCADARSIQTILLAKLREIDEVGGIAPRLELPDALSREVQSRTLEAVLEEAIRGYEGNRVDRRNFLRSLRHKRRHEPS